MVGTSSPPRTRWLCCLNLASSMACLRFVLILSKEQLHLIYNCMNQLLALVSLFIKLPQSTLGDVYQPISVQIAGIYTVVLVIAIEKLGHPGSTAAGISSPNAFERGTVSWRVATVVTLHGGQSDSDESPTSSQVSNDEYDPYDPYHRPAQAKERQEDQYVA